MWYLPSDFKEKYGKKNMDKLEEDMEYGRILSFCLFP